MARNTIRVFLSAALFLAPVPVLAQPASPDSASAGPEGAASSMAEGRDVDHARVSRVEGALFLKTPFDATEQPATINMILREGDQLRTADGAFAEVELPGRSFLRLASGARVHLGRLEESAEIELGAGSVEVSQAEGGFDVAVTSTRATGVGPLPKSRVRVDRDATGLVVRVLEGAADVTCADRPRRISASEPLRCTTDGRLEPLPLPSPDAFEGWSEARERAARGVSSVPPAVAATGEGLQDLEGHGQWVTIESRWYWRPAVSVTWRPYWDGYWTWYDAFGWTWIPYTPWGYVTHHYGRWRWFGVHGWVWAPAPVFSGAWVTWGAFDGYLGWAPCDFWGRPVVVLSPRSHYDHSVWTFSRPDYFYRGGGSWRGGPRIGQSAVPMPGERAGEVGQASDPGSKAISERGPERPFFALDSDEIRRLSPRPIVDPRSLVPESVASRAAPPTRTGAKVPPGALRERPIGAPPATALPTKPGVPSRSLLTELVERDRVREFRPHEAARDRPAFAFPRGQEVRPTTPLRPNLTRPNLSFPGDREAREGEGGPSPQPGRPSFTPRPQLKPMPQVRPVPQIKPAPRPVPKFERIPSAPVKKPVIVPAPQKVSPASPPVKPPPVTGTPKGQKKK